MLIEMVGKLDSGQEEKKLKAILSKASNNTQAENNNGLDNRFVCIFLNKKEWEETWLKYLR